ncbi:MAG: deoxyguanosinetriphosphate triphosphohydrolase [Lachnospiraceae bacterium]|nr:deoxyguanosinetriphosphate triphosphohydrolase [Lachnospiraceae bacterium]
MLIREEIEQREKKILSPYASLAAASRGRLAEEEPCDIRTCYQRDRDRIIHCKAFRRLKDKTQVFLSPQGDHYRTRLMHTLEVSQTSRTVAKALMLNEDLVEAIALGHDLGHTPFGHAGERALAAVCPLGFKHNEQSIRVVDRLEKGGEGLNLTWEVRDGILNHQTSRHPSTLEGQIVRLCDKISYIHHDMDDGERAGILKEEDIPEHLREMLGRSTKERLNTMIHDIIRASRGKKEILMSEDVAEAMAEMRRFMFERLYTNPKAKMEEVKATAMLQELYGYYTDHPDAMGSEYYAMIAEKGEKPERAVCDYISGMTDQYSIAKFKQIYVPRSWEKY